MVPCPQKEEHIAPSKHKEASHSLISNLGDALCVKSTVAPTGVCTACKRNLLPAYKPKYRTLL